MITPRNIKAPTTSELITLRVMILLGLLSIANFFYWFIQPELIENQILFWLLVVMIAFDAFKIVYIWYHYWHISVPEKPKVHPEFTVDIFTTYFPGEPYEMIKETLLAIQRIRYPHTTYLCDEANDQYLKQFCEQNGIVHVTRTNRIDAKAGNINNALKQASGELCLILDPDHVPFENILDELIPYFNDGKIGFVQSVQAYYNIGESLVARGAAEQTFHFYGPVMMTMNSYGTVNAIGANCLFRRKALDSIGGHAAGLSEDMHTAMRLHAQGWKSVYVPEVLTKGLSPASLTAYYKQQLKWSRGTLELLVAVFPKLFRKLSFRQKLHYGILPLFYLSGFFFLFNFLVPIVSLFVADTPWKGNVINFGLLFLPVFTSIIGIRFYIQKWLMFKSERGFHLVGGLLLTVTWWVFLIGSVYTLIRKKVPYLPTPKEDKEKTSWIILVPNLLIGVISVLAVIYGLSLDFTPFSMVMSGFALLNAFFMFSTLVFAFEKQKIVKFNAKEADETESAIHPVKDFAFRTWHRFALFAVVLIFLISGYYLNNSIYVRWEGVKPETQKKNIINYLGVFAPKVDNGITNLGNVNEISGQINENFDIVSIYLAWNNTAGEDFEKPLIDSIYAQKSIPLITWEPWTTTFDPEQVKTKHVFELIEEGYFDDFIQNFASKLRDYNRPVFLRFAHEFDNPFYPWYVSGNDGADLFKKAWIHTYEIFKNCKATNVIWIWNPWDPDNIRKFYPGEAYIDWIGVNILNYGEFSKDKKSLSFEDLYEPFHDEFKNIPAAPVIISEFGTLKSDPNQIQWLREAFYAMNTEYKEIKSVIYFNSKVDNNWPPGLQSDQNLDWTIPKQQIVKKSFDGKEAPEYVFGELPVLKQVQTTNPVLLPSGTKGINLKKGRNWRKDYHVLSRKLLLSDFRNMSQIGINTIKYEGNSVYNHNILKISKEFNFSVYYGFYIPAEIDFLRDTTQTAQLSDDILNEVRKYRNTDQIIAWNIQNDVLYNQKHFFQKPELLFQNNAYINWLHDLLIEIKKLDPIRPVLVDLEVHSQSVNFAKIHIDHVGNIDAFGLVIKDTKNLSGMEEYLKSTQTHYCYSQIEVGSLAELKPETKNPTFFITAWQDAHESNRLTFEGLIDRKGRFKTEYFQLADFLNGKTVTKKEAVTRMLKPAIPIYDGYGYTYYAMSFDSIKGWISGDKTPELEFEWSLIKCDEKDDYLAIKEIGSGPVLVLNVPENHSFYKLMLTTLKNKKVISTQISTINTPLVPAIN